MAPSLRIRPVMPADKKQWQVLWGDYNAFYGRSGDTALPDEIVNATWQRFFDNMEPVHGLVAELEGKRAGLAHYIFHRNTSTIEPTCYLQDLFTSYA